MKVPDTRVTVTGTIEHITYHNPDNHFTIARLRVDGTRNLISILGYLPPSGRGETIRATGHWEKHPRYGPQLKVERYDSLLPDTVDGIRRYLASGVIPGIGAKTVERLVSHFGADLLQVIEEAPHRLTEVRRIGPGTADRIVQAWQTHHAARRLMAFLQAHDLSPSFCGPLLKAYGEEALSVLEKTPFRLVDDLPGRGFQIADAIARRQGTPADDPDRIRACLLHLLSQAVAEGHVCLPETNLRAQGQERFGIDPADMGAVIKISAHNGEIVCDRSEPADAIPRIYLQTLYEAETGIAARLGAMQMLDSPAMPCRPEDITATVIQRLAIKPSGDQLDVLQGVLNHRVAVITGGPGTGKTTLIRSLCAVFEAMGRRVCLAAPTGRAARRLSEVTRHQAATLHKLLGYNPVEGGFAKDQDDPIDADVFVIDEASMIDTPLAYHFLKAVPLSAALIWVGDVFQLPPVGPGKVLKDIIDAGRTAVYHLTQVFRQQGESPIVLNAHRIREGRMPEVKKTDTREIAAFHFIEENRPEAVVRTIVDLCVHQLPRQFDFDPIRDIQVLTPMHKGEVGTINLNQTLQRHLNHRPDPAGFTLQAGDKVMHLRNNYVKAVFNGDIGRVEEVNAKQERLTVSYDDRRVNYDFGERDELTLAYAISVHKSQGSEYPAVVVPLLTQHFALLQRNLLYTAITRGREVVVIVGSKRALAVAVQNNRPRQRLSFLHERLVSG
ncbi:MAG: ATP-dependent RecD-like DNA helicase [Desulfosarcina sp.]|nr:ATP-dependent RecD-like DNA helicase [Desulfobacterales bacterium]